MSLWQQTDYITAGFDLVMRFVDSNKNIENLFSVNCLELNLLIVLN